VSQRRGLSRIVRTAGAVVAGMLVVAGCGSAASKTAPPKPPAPTTTTTVESAETRLWVEAAANGVKNSPDMKASASDAECLGRALVETLTVPRLQAAGVTTSNLADPNADLPPSLVASLSRPTMIALGTALQACGDGFLAAYLAQSVAQDAGSWYALDAPTRACVNRWFSTPDHHALLASMVLNGQPKTAEASQLVDLIVTCLDVAALIAPSMQTTFSPTESACIDRLARADQAFRFALAAGITDSGNSGTTHAETLFGVRILKCLSPAHVLQIAQAND